MSMLQPGQVEDPETEREFVLTIRGKYYGKGVQVQALARRVRRILVHLVRLRIESFKLDGEELIDDYADDKGESWHSLDWRAEDAEDEGLHQ